MNLQKRLPYTRRLLNNLIIDSHEPGIGRNICIVFFIFMFLLISFQRIIVMIIANESCIIYTTPRTDYI
jgi:hypothetical protein